MISLVVMNILLWIAGIIGFVGIAGIIPFSVIGIIFLAKHSNENDAVKKGSLKKKGIIFLVLPWALALIGLIILMALIVIRPLLNI
jgi:F0F1-type ATP synthase membrane subunit c/vacuolar-type H+-ATPase subunit K